MQDDFEAPVQPDTKQPAAILSLPIDLLHEIFRRIPKGDLSLISLYLVCKKFYNATTYAKQFNGTKMTAASDFFKRSSLKFQRCLDESNQHLKSAQLHLQSAQQHRALARIKKQHAHVLVQQFVKPKIESLEELRGKMLNALIEIKANTNEDLQRFNDSLDNQAFSLYGYVRWRYTSCWFPNECIQNSILQICNLNAISNVVLLGLCIWGRVTFIFPLLTGMMHVMDHTFNISLNTDHCSRSYFTDVSGLSYNQRQELKMLIQIYPEYFENINLRYLTKEELKEHLTSQIAIAVEQAFDDVNEAQRLLREISDEINRLNVDEPYFSRNIDNGHGIPYRDFIKQITIMLNKMQNYLERDKYIVPEPLLMEDHSEKDSAENELTSLLVEEDDEISEKVCCLMC